MHFCLKRKLHNDPALKLEEIEILAEDQYKFLGVLLDKKKLAFIPHLKHFKNKK